MSLPRRVPKLAVNYSPQAAELVAGGHIPLDLFKCPDWPELVNAARKVRPVYVHFPLELGRGTVPDTDWEALTRFLEETGTSYVNVHLYPDIERFPGLSVTSHEAQDIARVKAAFVEELKLLAERVGAERVIAENVIYRGDADDVPRVAVDPELIRDVLEASGSGLLLDVSHARISARHLGVDERTYLSALPTERLKELHVTGMVYTDGRWRDHRGFGEEDWEVLEWVFAQIRTGAWATPEIVAFEYGGVGPIFEKRSDPEVLASQVPRLYELVKRTA